MIDNLIQKFLEQLTKEQLVVMYQRSLGREIEYKETIKKLQALLKEKVNE